MSLLQLRHRKLRVLAATLALPLVLNGCLFGKDDKDCFAEDQRGSIMPALENFPIQVVADSRFSNYEYNQIAGAVAEWNATTRAMMGQSFFTLVSGNVLSAKSE